MFLIFLIILHSALRNVFHKILNAGYHELHEHFQTRNHSQRYHRRPRRFRGHVPQDLLRPTPQKAEAVQGRGLGGGQNERGHQVTTYRIYETFIDMIEETTFLRHVFNNYILRAVICDIKYFL